MNTFLHYIAKDLTERYGTDLSHTAVVFPNKRAALFLNEELARCAGKPVWAPAYLTISDLFRKYSTLQVGDPIKLVVELYKSYTHVTGKDETLDRFYDWGRLLISDFDDVDKHMADAQKVFANIANIHELDDVSYLSVEQKEILSQFFGSFSDEHNSMLKEMFLSLWKKLGDIYQDFRQRILRQGIAYEGLLYREVVEKNLIKKEYDRYIFVGFNMLHKVEQQLFLTLKAEGAADFYWDYDYFYTRVQEGCLPNEAGKYINQYLKLFGDSLSEKYRKDAYDNFRKKKDVTFIKAKTENIQARHVSEWLVEKQRFLDGKRTAIVMCDETLLQSIIHAVPTCVDNVNITSGFPLSQTPVAAFVTQLINLRVSGTREDGGFRISFVRKVTEHPYAAFISDCVGKVARHLHDDRILFPTQKDLVADEATEFLFKSIEGNEDTLRWLLGIMRMIANGNDDTLYVESVFSMYTILNRLLDLVSEGELSVDPVTMQKLIGQLISSTTIPFHGEPAVGIQIMGLLETRNLDFDHLLILSCNEGNMPNGIRDSSFIPYSIRKAYGLTTVDNKVAIYSYYYHRLLEKAEDVTIMYNTSTENGSRGEMSRFMLQMMVESPHPIRRVTLHASLNTDEGDNREVDKDAGVMEKLLSYSKLSPTALNRYLRCPLQFFYNNIAGIREPDDDIEEQLSSRAFGNIFHNASEEIYKNLQGTGRMVTESVISQLARKEHIAEVVDRMFQREMFGDDERRWRKIQYNGMQLISREVIVRYISRLLEIDKKLAPFNILALETDVCGKVKVVTPEGEKTVCVGGRIDRLDMVTDRETGKRTIRVIDYKTGGSDISSPVAQVEDIFDPAKAGGKSHTDYYLQSMLYALLVASDKGLNPDGLPVSPALIFIQRSFSENYDPTIYINKVKVADVKEFAGPYAACMESLLAEIYDAGRKFTPTPQRALCEYCPYRELCGR